MYKVASSSKLSFLRRPFYSNANKKYQHKPLIAIRREDASIWERRAPLAPHHVERIVKSGARVLIQPSNRRAYPIQSYIRAGAEESEDISEAPVILGVKQVPKELLIPNKTYCFFSHTIKAQEANMQLLDAVLDKNIRLIDYECLKDDDGNRKVAFGKFAGYAGMVDILHGIGLRLLALGHHTPFMHIGPAHNYRNVGAAKQAVRDAGYEIALGNMPRSIGPLTFVFTGTGNVSQGAQEVFGELPIEYVDVKNLREVAERGSTNKIYGAILSRSDYLVRRNELAQSSSKRNQFNIDEYNEFPERYESVFSQRIAPYTSVIINGIFWEERYPRLLTKADAHKLQKQPDVYQSNAYNTFTDATNKSPSQMKRVSDELRLKSIGSPSLPHRLIAICDISADPSGSIEFMDRCSEIDKPFYLYDSDLSTSTEDLSQNGILICSIDNMPTQLPLEATNMFGNLLLPYIPEIMNSNAQAPVEEEGFCSVVERAIIASNGKLRPNFEKIDTIRKEREQFRSILPSGCKSVLVLGAGHVSGPLVDHLCQDPNYQVTVTGLLESEFDKLRPLGVKNNNLRTIKLNCIENQDTLKTLINNSDLVVSLLPNTLHRRIAELCIECRRNMVTTSYMNAELKELDEQSREAGITILNEVGLDPGIDHLIARKLIDEVSETGGRITSFESYCCGLPTPEFASNPLGYKYGWNPRGAFSVILNPAKWMQNGNVMEAKPGKLMDYAFDVNFLKGFNLEAFPNRDSTFYQDLYKLPDAKTLIRGTLRYKGFSDTIKVLRELGFMDTSAHPMLQPEVGSPLTWPMWLAINCGHPAKISQANLQMILEQKLGKSPNKLTTLAGLGLFDPDTHIEKRGSPFETIREWIIKRYPFGAEDNDVIMMKIIMEILRNGNDTEQKSLTMVVYGDVGRGGFSAMSKTVGYTAGIASKMIVEGEIKTKGMILPLEPEIYEPILKRLAKYGIKAC